MVQDRCMVFIKVEWEVVCALSNDDIASDIGWPLIAQTTPMSTIFAAFHIFVVGWSWT